VYLAETTTIGRTVADESRVDHNFRLETIWGLVNSHVDIAVAFKDLKWLPGTKAGTFSASTGRRGWSISTAQTLLPTRVNFPNHQICGTIEFKLRFKTCIVEARHFHPRYLRARQQGLEYLDQCSPERSPTGCCALPVGRFGCAHSDVSLVTFRSILLPRR
jgi:hypothetical protein